MKEDGKKEIQNENKRRCLGFNAGPLPQHSNDFSSAHRKSKLEARENERKRQGKQKEVVREMQGGTKKFERK